MSVHGSDPQDEALRQHQHEAVADEWVRRHFSVEPSEDRSGLLAGQPTPAPGERDEPDEDEPFAAYMLRYFPGSVV